MLKLKNILPSKIIIPFLYTIIFHTPILAQEIHSLSSPSQNLKTAISIDKNSVRIDLFREKGKIVTVKTMQFTLEGETENENWHTTDITEKNINQTWRPVYGERSQIPDHYRECELKLKSENSRKEVSLKVRLYDEGLAFQHIFNKEDFRNRTLTDEKNQFFFENNFPAWVTKSAQGAYSETTLDKLNGSADRPQVVQISDGCFTAIGEAALVDYARMKLKKSDTGTGLQSALSGKVNLDMAGYHSPWRYVMVASHPGQLVENNYLLLNLNDPCQIKDTSWIKPGKVLREVTLTTQGGLACVDFAALNHIEYIEFDAGWYGPENDPSSDATTITVDPKRSAGPLDLHKIIKYAQSKGVGVIVYVNKNALKKQLDTILPLYKKWGIKGIKFGFVDVGDQKSTAWLHHAVRKAAQYGLMVDIHDEYRPTGYSRTYPNLVTQEGIRGDEESPELKQTIFTLYNRMICGAGDYTNCYFAERVTKKMGGKGAQLAKLVAIYSPWQFIYWYDRPEESPSRAGGAGAVESIIQKDAITRFYCTIPTVWEETRFLEGKMGEYAVVARRSSSDWYVAILNAGKKRNISLPLEFIKEKAGKTITLYQQREKNKDELIATTIKGTEAEPLSVDIEENSGCVLHFGAEQ